MNIFKWFRWFIPKPKPKDFILTKEYEIKGKKKGGLVLRIEQHNGTAWKCSKGSFQIDINGKIFWKANGYIDISTSNIERVLQIHSAQTLLSKNIEKVK